MIKILKKSTGNCNCQNCGKLQDGLKLQPFTVWHKAENEKRGHNYPVCSQECANELAKRLDK